MNEEIWKDIPGYEGYYMASNFGRIKSLPQPTVPGQFARRGILSPYVGNNGYCKVTLRTPGTKWVAPVPKLIALTFLGEPNGLHVCHNNGNKTDDRLENLRYDTAKGNNRDKIRHGTHQSGEKNPRHKLTEAQVRQIQSDRRLTRIIARDYGVSQTLICYIQRGKLWPHLRMERPQSRSLSRSPVNGRFVSHVA